MDSSRTEEGGVGREGRRIAWCELMLGPSGDYAGWAGEVPGIRGPATTPKNRAKSCSKWLALAHAPILVLAFPSTSKECLQSV